MVAEPVAAAEPGAVSEAVRKKQRNNSHNQPFISTEMKKKSIIILLVIVGALFFWGMSVYNSLVPLEEETTAQFANVQTQYQRRADLIPNLVNTVKGYAAHERETLEAVIAARNQAENTKVDNQAPTEGELQRYQAAQDGVSSALSRLLMVVERYPELKADKQFTELQAQLEGTENRIAVARKNFNDSVQKYNATIRHFPKNIFASVLGFKRKAYFEAEAGAEKAPKVEF